MGPYALISLPYERRLILKYRKMTSTEWYSEGLRNENNGSYRLALNNYENALSEIRKLRRNSKFGRRIADRIRILRTTIEYENNFQTSHNELL